MIAVILFDPTLTEVVFSLTHKEISNVPCFWTVLTQECQRMNWKCSWEFPLSVGITLTHSLTHTGKLQVTYEKKRCKMQWGGTDLHKSCAFYILPTTRNRIFLTRCATCGILESQPSWKFSTLSAFTYLVWLRALEPAELKYRGYSATGTIRDNRIPRGCNR